MAGSPHKGVDQAARDSAMRTGLDIDFPKAVPLDWHAHISNSEAIDRRTVQLADGSNGLFKLTTIRSTLP
jgi:hypothetical protein